MKGLEAHIKDTNLLRLIKRFLKAGIMENGKYVVSESGTPQGSILSPVLANIVMYYGIVLYIEKIKKIAKGYVEIVNYADDMILCFQYKSEAEQIYNLLKERLRKLGLEFAPDKTRLIQFGRFASTECKKHGRNKPETFDFLGFTHYCSKSANGKWFRVKRKTSKKKFKQKVQEYKMWIKNHMILSLKEIMATTNRKLIGHYNYYGITDNIRSLILFKRAIEKILFKWLNRRSQRKSYNWDKFNQMLKYFPLAKIMKSRMRESCTYGSVRVIQGNLYFYSINNDSRIKYSAKLLSYFINIDYARLLNSLKLDKSDFNKNKND